MIMTFPLFETRKNKKTLENIARMEEAVQEKRFAEAAAQRRLHEMMEKASRQIERLPIAGALTGRQHNDV